MRTALRVDGSVDGLPLGSAFAILEAVASAPSLLAAARTLGISYRSAWSRLAAIEAALGQRVVVKTKGHGTVLTPYGRAFHACLADAFGRLAPVLRAEETRLADAMRALRQPEHPRLRLAASHDPLLVGTVTEMAGIELGVAGSLDALAQLRAGKADAAGFHYGARGAPPAPFDAVLADPELAVHPLFDREQGFMLPPGNPLGVASIADVARLRLRFVNRQRGAGTRIWFERLCREAGLAPEDISGARTEEFTHQAVAALIATGEADVGMGTPAVAGRFGLAFHSVGWETYFLAVRADWCRARRQTGAGPRTSGGHRGSPLPEGERQGEGCDPSGGEPHLTPTLSVQEQESRGASCRRAIAEETVWDDPTDRSADATLAGLLDGVAAAARTTLGYGPPSTAYQSTPCG